MLNDGWQQFQKNGGLVLGYGIAKELGVSENDWVTLLISFANSDNQLSQPLRYRIQVTGILRLDGQLDHSYALMSLSQAQVLLDYAPDEITGVELKVQDPFAVRNMTYEYLYDYPQRLQVQD